MNWNRNQGDEEDKEQPQWPDMSQMAFNLPPNILKMAKFLVIPAAFIIVIIILSVMKGIWTEWLWFSNLGFSSVYGTIIKTSVSLFLVSSFIFLVIFGGNLLIAQRLGPKSAIPLIPAASSSKIRKMTIAGMAAGAILLSIIYGSTAQGNWETLLKFQNGQTFGITDPIFNKDVAFYLFSLPFQQFLQGWMLGALIITLIATIGFYVFNYRIRRLSFDITIGIKTHLSIMVAAILGLYTWRYFLDIYNLVYSERGVVFGAGYTDIHAQLIAYKILIAVSIVCAIAVLANIFLKGFRVPGYALGLLVISIIVISTIYPAAVQRFQVNPAELNKEAEYIGYNIDFTRQAFGLDRIEVKPFAVDENLTREDISANAATINNIRLWDNRPLKDTYRATEALRLYYDFYDIDIDRYEIDGEYRQVMLGARELYQEKLDVKAQTWVNQRLVYTHGYGLVLSPVTEVIEGGTPLLQVSGFPPSSDFERLQIEQPGIYYGEKTNDYVIVNTKRQELDYPLETDNMLTTYQGKGGVSLSSFFRKLAYAWHFGDFNILISDRLNPESRLLYHRNIEERIHQIAPFLKFDSDPYIVITEDGKLVWIQDAYTWSDKYPYSEPYSGINYIRNSVKAVVDAYDGSVTLYIIDPDDPVVQTYQTIFPDLFTPGEDIPADIREHLRYPEDLFVMQAEVYQRYHMQDETAFYGKEDMWSTPSEKYRDTEQPMDPYYIIMRLPDEEQEEFLLMLPFTPTSKKTAIAWLAARSDGENYGKLLAYNLPKEKSIHGPMLIENRIEQDTEITEKFNLWRGGGSTVLRGNLLMIPIENSFLYVEPIFLQGASGGLPELKRVIVATSDTIAMENTLEEALAAIFGDETLEPTPSPTPGPTSTPGPTPTPGEEPSSDLNALLISIQQHQLKEKEYAGAGDWAAAGEERTAWEAEFLQLVDLITELSED